MTLEEKLLALQIEGFYVEEGVVPEDRVAAIRRSTEATIDEGAGKIQGSTFLNFNQSLAPYLADERILEVARTLLGPSARIISTSGNRQEAQPGARPAPPGGYHSDWPWGNSGASFVQAPLPDVMINLTTFWMLSSFTRENGATVVVPGTHRAANNPNGNADLARARPTEMQVEAPAGSVLVFDGRLWHKGGVNGSHRRRVFWGVNYAPWWINCHARRPHSVEHRIQAEAGHVPAGHWPYIKAEVFDALPDHVKPLLRHWVDREWIMTRADAEKAIMDTSYFA